MSVNMNAFLLGQAVRAYLAGRGAKPVAFLYNGVRLPKLPEWDKTAYPYAYITETKNHSLESLNGFNVWFCDKPVHAKLELNGDYHFHSNGVAISYLKAKYSDGEWGSLKKANSSLYQMSYPVWANTDMYTLKENADTGETEMTNTVALAASDPIPVYE